jgi:hypothetical protein
LVVALLALFFAIGGPSFAADAAGGAVRLITGKQVRNNSLTTKDVRNGSLLAADFKPGQLPVGAQGPKGDTGAKGDTGPAGAPGTNGTDGADGSDGSDGDDGTSVTSTSEPAGPNCPDGGVRFTSASGDSYACDGAKGDTGSAGTTGQAASSVFGTGALTVTPTTPTTDLPGLTTTMTVPANSRLYIATDGGLQTSSTAATGFSTVDVAVSVDGALLTNGLYARVICANTTGVMPMSCRWSMSAAITLASGSHTIKVVGMGINSGSNASVSGGTGSVNQGTLSVVILKT